jgi:uncharacterized membrane protein
MMKIIALAVTSYAGYMLWMSIFYFGYLIILNYQGAKQTRKYDNILDTASRFTINWIMGAILAGILWVVYFFMMGVDYE